MIDQEQLYATFWEKSTLQMLSHLIFFDNYLRWKGRFQDGALYPGSWYLCTDGVFPHWNGIICVTSWCVNNGVMFGLKMRLYLCFSVTSYIASFGSSQSLCFGGHLSSPNGRSVRDGVAVLYWCPSRPDFLALWVSHLGFSKPSEAFRLFSLRAVHSTTREPMSKSPSQTSTKRFRSLILGHQWETQLRVTLAVLFCPMSGSSLICGS